MHGRLNQAIFGSKHSSEERSSEDYNVQLVQAVLPAMQFNASSPEILEQGLETILPALDTVIKKADRVISMEPELRRSMGGQGGTAGRSGGVRAKAQDPSARSEPSIAIDVCFLVDCTNSMDQFLDAVRDGVVEIASEISHNLDDAGQKVTLRTSFVGFRDYSNEPLAPGLKWEDAGYERPAQGHPIANHALAAAMRQKLVFSVEELRAMRLGYVAGWEGRTG
jgi:hypothetical protein